MNTTIVSPSLDERLDSRRGDPGPVVGVKTTKIYCRMICRSGRGPKPENCVPFLNTAAARAAGYRACKVCRPDDDRKEETLMISYGVGSTPIGPIFVAATERGVCGIFLLESEESETGLERLRYHFPNARCEPDPTVAEAVVPRVVSYLVEGDPCDDVPLDMHGTPFQRKVWDGLRAIPWGTTTTYRGLAESIGLDAKSARPVGMACGSNPISLIVPCHRVLSSSGGLGGYYWGLERKRAVLDLESAHALQSSS